MIKSGDKFTRLTVIRTYRPIKNGGGRKAEVKCKCGNIKIVLCTDLKRGKTKSCGCLQKESVKYRARRITKDPEVTLLATRKALNASMTENTGLIMALNKIRDTTSEVHTLSIIHKALNADFHAEREEKSRVVLCG